MPFTNTEDVVTNKLPYFYILKNVFKNTNNLLTDIKMPAPVYCLHIFF